MKTKLKWTRNARTFLSTMLALALVFSLFAAMPITAQAADETFFADAFNAIPGLTAVADTTTHTVTVTGALATAVDVPLDIDSGVTILMEANYSGTTDKPMITLNGSGTFVVGEGGSIKNSGTGAAIYSEGANATVVIDGGTVSTTSAFAILVVDGTVRINSGIVSSPLGDATTAVIIASGTVEMNGGTVSCTAEGRAIAVEGSSSVRMTGGTVTATTGAGIAALGDGSSVTMSGGTVTATTGVAIGAYGDNSEIRVTNGTVSATTGFGIGAIGINSNVTVSGGTVSATNQEAIAVGGAGAKVTLNGGLVFAYGQDVTGEGNVINMVNDGTPTIGGSAVAIAWDKPTSGTPAYSEGSTTDLTVAPDGATAAWGKSGSQNGIKYGSSGFFPISGVTVNDAAPTTFTVTFNSNSGSAVASQPVNSGGTATKPSPDPTREGYTFGGWYSDEAFTAEYVFTTPVTASITLYARWTEAVATPPDTGSASGSMSNFTRTRTYTPGMFSDVVESMWYGFNGDKSVANAYEYELMSGSSATTFNPAGNITIAEAITVATRVHSFYTTGHQVEFAPIPGAKWYQGNVNYAIEKGIITATDFSDYGLAATRAQMAYIFSRSIPASEFASQNTVNTLPDVNNGTPYYSAILMMYKAGVVGGDEGTGAFRPGSNISRAEAAAIITRVIIPASRLSGRVYG